jgi:anti-sigma-K factor RskA
MKLGELHNKLTTAARLQKPDDRVPYAFEKRIMALIAAQAAVADRWAVWSRGLWRAALSCVAVTLVFVAVSLFMPSATDNSNDLSQDFENTLLASADQPDTSSIP